LTIAEPPVDDFGLGNAGGNWGYRGGTVLPARHGMRQQNCGYTLPRPQPGLIVVSTMTPARTVGKMGWADQAVNDD